MRRIWALTMVLCLLLCMTACGKDSTVEQAGGSEHHAMITKAVAAVKDHWRSLYETDGPGTDGHFEIKNTRVITVKKNEIKLFQNVAYIIEFVIYTDWFGSAPYYENVGRDDTVVVYRDGTMQVKDNQIRAYRSTTYQMDYSGFISKIDDYREQYNCVQKLR